MIAGCKAGLCIVVPCIALVLSARQDLDAAQGRDDQAVPVVLVGVILDAQSGAPVPGAALRVTGTRRGAIADSTGWYQLQLPTGDSVVHVCVDRLDYEPQRHRVPLRVEPALRDRAAAPPDTFHVLLRATRRVPHPLGCAAYESPPTRTGTASALCDDPSVAAAPCADAGRAEPAATARLLRGGTAGFVGGAVAGGAIGWLAYQAACAIPVLQLGASVAVARRTAR